jgi:hypothetical protein
MKISFRVSLAINTANMFMKLPHSAVCFAVRRVNLDSSLAVHDSSMEISQFIISSRSVAVINGIFCIKHNCPGTKTQLRNIFNKKNSSIPSILLNSAKVIVLFDQIISNHFTLLSFLFGVNRGLRCSSVRILGKSGYHETNSSLISQIETYNLFLQKRQQGNFAGGTHILRRNVVGTLKTLHGHLEALGELFGGSLGLHLFGQEAKKAADESLAIVHASDLQW